MKKLLITSLLLTSLIIVGCDKEEEIDKVSNKIANEMTENNSSYDDAANKVLDSMNITSDDVPEEIAEEVEDKTAEIVEQQTEEDPMPVYEEPAQKVINPEVPIQGEDLTPQERIFNAEAENGIQPENLSYVESLTLDDGQVVKIYVDMYELGMNSMIYLYATSEDGKVGVVYNFGTVYEAAHTNYFSSKTVVTIHWLNSNEDPIDASDKMELLKVVMKVKDKELDARQAFGQTLN